MSDVIPTKPGPALATEIAEVHGTFASEAAMNAAVARLTEAGFDHADFSLPSPAPANATPEQGAETLTSDTDMRQARTLGTSLAASAGALAAAGITIATGGAAALAIGAAVVAGGGAAALAGTVGAGAGEAQHEAHGEAAARGTLVLSVRTPDATRATRATQAMQAAGATQVQTVTRSGG